MMPPTPIGSSIASCLDAVAPIPDPPVTGNLAGLPTPHATQPTILDEAAKITSTDRQAVYGHPKDNWARTAEVASALLGRPISPTDCVRVAVAMKLARLRQTPDHRDSLVDLAGYAWVWSEVEGV